MQGVKRATVKEEGEWSMAWMKQGESKQQKSVNWYGFYIWFCILLDFHGTSWSQTAYSLAYFTLCVNMQKLFWKLPGVQ